MNLPKIIVILGPTASGKTALSLLLAKKFDGMIISADSRQIYRGMDIGTAKPTKKELVQIPHQLIDCKNPDQNYTLGQYKTDATRAMKKIIESKKLPFLVGGTGLYVYALVNNLQIPKVKPNKTLRRKLERMIEKYGLYYAFGKLTALDPETAYIVDPHNPRRIVRALEVAMSTKKPFSQSRKKNPPIFDFLILGINIPPETLRQRINQRVDLMVKQGLVEEVTRLTKKYGKRRIPFDAIGYREIIDYLDKKLDLGQATDQIKRNTWRFAKRQMTWFKRLPVTWITNQKQANREIEKFVDR